MNALTSNTPAIIPNGTTSGPLASPATPETTETQPVAPPPTTEPEEDKKKEEPSTTTTGVVTQSTNIIVEAVDEESPSNPPAVHEIKPTDE